MKLRTLLATFVLVLCSAFLAPGCAAIAAALPDVIAAVTDGAQIIDAIEHFVALYFASHPDADKQKAVGEAITKARSALNLALRSAQGAKDLDDAKIDAAFADFKAAYLELIALCAPYGVKQAKVGRFAAAPGSLIVPEPIAFAPHKAAH